MGGPTGLQGVLPLDVLIWGGPAGLHGVLPLDVGGGGGGPAGLQGVLPLDVLIWGGPAGLHGVLPLDVLICGDTEMHGKLFPAGRNKVNGFHLGGGVGQ
ncbi:hypothetical protein LWI28_024446 [Acer negundo]|uniref:Uncharacterized protein n=1 Tax=Acer negundo TaxID=4023 RepID=A0AAD5JEG3_ACENE|nr:hypothetical protein LWI28_024446 [Acer negundo]